VLNPVPNADKGRPTPGAWGLNLICFLDLLKRLGLFLSFAMVMLAALISRAGTGGSVSGTVKDASGAVVPDANVSAKNFDTGVQFRSATNGRGFYSFPELPVGRYTIAIEKKGFKLYRRTAITVDTNRALTVDAVLDVGSEGNAVTVIDTAVHAETSETQMGEVIDGKKIEAVPLNGRSYTDLLALQPGVVPATSLTSNTQQDVGVSALSPSGGLNPGTISINGQREFSNAFIVNGSDAEEDMNSGTAIIPNLDSISEFRILTSNFDAEYGGHSGGQINVVTKSGTNVFHGDAFEFVRNTNLDARNYFSPTRGAFDQNQFGGTFGGPIRRNKDVFLHGLSRDSIDGGCGYGPNCGANRRRAQRRALLMATLSQQSEWSSERPGHAKNLLQYIPQPNVGANNFATSAYNETLRDDKGAYRLDYNSHGAALGLLFSGRLHPQQSLSGGAERSERAGLQRALPWAAPSCSAWAIRKTLGSTAVNEFHFTYMRDHNDLGKPIGGLGVSLASQGFVTGEGTPGIVPLNPQGEGVENIVFNAFSIGTNANELKQVNNTFQWIDNFSKVVGRHTLKFGQNFTTTRSTPTHRAIQRQLPVHGERDGSDFADFLLGFRASTTRASCNRFTAAINTGACTRRTVGACAPT
jgi:hypothetical protein